MILAEFWVAGRGPGAGEHGQGQCGVRWSPQQNAARYTPRRVMEGMKKPRRRFSVCLGG